MLEVSHAGRLLSIAALERVATDIYTGGGREGARAIRKTITFLEEAPDEIERLEAQVRELKAENARLYRMAYLTIPVPRWLRRKRP